MTFSRWHVVQVFASYPVEVCAQQRQHLCPERYQEPLEFAQVSREEAEAWCHARGASYAEMRSPDDIAALGVTIESLVRECVCGGRETQL